MDTRVLPGAWPRRNLPPSGVQDLSIRSDLVKLVSMNVLGMGLVVLSFSGLWLCHGPRWVRRHKHSAHH